MSGMRISYSDDDPVRNGRTHSLYGINPSSDEATPLYRVTYSADDPLFQCDDCPNMRVRSELHTVACRTDSLGRRMIRGRRICGTCWVKTKLPVSVQQLVLGAMMSVRG